MTEKELKKLNRYQLLELLLLQTQRSDDLQKKLEEASKQQQVQELQVFALGSIAEASLQLSGIFDSAQKAADLYLESARQKAVEIEAEARRKADAMIEEARKNAYTITTEAKKNARRLADAASRELMNDYEDSEI